MEAHLLLFVAFLFFFENIQQNISTNSSFGGMAAPSLERNLADKSYKVVSWKKEKGNFCFQTRVNPSFWRVLTRTRFVICLFTRTLRTFYCIQMSIEVVSLPGVGTSCGLKFRFNVAHSCRLLRYLFSLSFLEQNYIRFVYKCSILRF